MPFFMIVRLRTKSGIHPGRSREFVPGRRAVEVVLNVVLARPDHLHGAVHPGRDFRGLDHEVLLGAPAEAAAEEGRVDPGIFRADAGRLGRRLP
jgi:hypothetical protein